MSKTKYQITLIVESDINPRKWIAELVSETLDCNEKLIEWDCEVIEEDDQKQQDQ